MEVGETSNLRQSRAEKDQRKEEQKERELSE